ncbi:hypothetical protein H0H93_009663 [Arthromyces matolae]|nr:hypothetical protein H0H93_009663 [Arthromyces matolae]
MAFSGAGAPAENIHEFLAIVAEETGSTDLIGPSKLQIQQSLKDAVPMVMQAIQSSLESSLQIPSALKCFQSWISTLTSNDITPLIPLLISLLNRTTDDDGQTFEAASDALQEIMTRSPLSDGSGSRTLTEPLLIWADLHGSHIIQTTLQSGEVDQVSHSFCKLLVAIGDHSTSYIAANLASPVSVEPIPPIKGVPTKTRAELSQSFLRLLLAYTGLPGYYGVDEEESEMTLAFWYLFQEALWNLDYYLDEEEENNGTKPIDSGAEVQAVAKAVYSELVQVLRRKVGFPGKGNGWSKDQVEKFQVYRRDVGDTLINAYYVLRDEMLGYLVEDAVQRLNAKQEQDGWQEIEATLHCIASIQEAIALEQTPHLPRVFGPEILGRLPSAGASRIRRTTLNLIGITNKSRQLSRVTLARAVTSHHNLRNHTLAPSPTTTLTHPTSHLNMDFEEDPDLARAIALSLEQANQEREVIEIEDSVDEDDARFQEELRQALSASEAETLTNNKSTAHVASPSQSEPEPTPPPCVSPAGGITGFLSERAQMEKERLARQKRLRPDTHDNATPENEDDEDEPPAKRQQISRSYAVPARNNPASSSSRRNVEEPRQASTSTTQEETFWNGELRQTATQHAEPRQDGKPTFRLTEVLGNHPNLPIKAIEELRMRWDWSKVKVHLVPSLAGKHEGWPAVIRSGHPRVMQVVRNMGLRTGKGKNSKEVALECQGSSIGIYTTQWFNEFHWSARGESAEDWLDDSKTKRAKLPYPPISVVYPTLATVKATRLGEQGGGTLFCRRKQWAATNFPRDHFCDSKSKGGPVLMHSKMIIATHRTPSKGKQPVGSETEDDDSDIEVIETAVGWAYIGSHNFTPSAWGTLSGSAFNPILNISNYELGIVFPLKDKEHADMVACFQRPPTKYTRGDVPWVSRLSDGLDLLQPYADWYL